MCCVTTMKKSKVARAVDMNDNLTDGAKGKPRRETGGGSRWDRLLTRDRRSRKRREAKWEANAESTPQVATSRKTHPFRQQQIRQNMDAKSKKMMRRELVQQNNAPISAIEAAKRNRCNVACHSVSLRSAWSDLKSIFKGCVTCKTLGTNASH